MKKISLKRTFLVTIFFAIVSLLLSGLLVSPLIDLTAFLTGWDLEIGWIPFIFAYFIMGVVFFNVCYIAVISFMRLNQCCDVQITAVFNEKIINKKKVKLFLFMILIQLMTIFIYYTASDWKDAYLRRQTIKEGSGVAGSLGDDNGSTEQSPSSGSDQLDSSNQRIDEKGRLIIPIDLYFAKEGEYSFKGDLFGDAFSRITKLEVSYPDNIRTDCFTKEYYFEIKKPGFEKIELECVTEYGHLFYSKRLNEDIYLTNLMLIKKGVNDSHVAYYSDKKYFIDLEKIEIPCSKFKEITYLLETNNGVINNCCNKNARVVNWDSYDNFGSGGCRFQYIKNSQDGIRGVCMPPCGDGLCDGRFENECTCKEDWEKGGCNYRYPQS